MRYPKLVEAWPSLNKAQEGMLARASSVPYINWYHIDIEEAQN